MSATSPQRKPLQIINVTSVGNSADRIDFIALFPEDKQVEITFFYLFSIAVIVVFT